MDRVGLILKTFLLVAVTLAAVPLFAGADAVRENSFAIDFLTFRADQKQKTVVEILCEIPAANLQFVKSEEWFSARYEIAIAVQNLTSFKTSNLTYRDSITVNNFKEIAKAQPHLVRIPLIVSPQEYLISVRIRDLEAGSHFDAHQNLVVPDYWTQPALSDLQLATALSSSNQQLGLRKNQMNIQPCVSKTLPLSQDSIFVYSEIYNLPNSHNGSGGSLRAELSIMNSEGVATKTFDFDYTFIDAPSTLCVGLAIGDLKPGAYTLALTVWDNSGTEFSNRTEFKIVGRKELLSDTEFSKIMRQLAVFASLKELDDLKSLPSAERALGLAKFWQKRDPIPETAQNELQMEFLERISYANEKFIYAKGEGWESEQGQVYVKCGRPTYVDRYKTNLGFRTYEVWEYINLNRKFVFVDIAGFGEFRLVNPREDDDLPFWF